MLAGVLECFDAMTGRRIWRRPATGSTLLVDGDVCFVGGEGAVTCVAAHDGRQLWTDGFKGYGIGWVAIAVPGHAAQADAS